MATIQSLIWEDPILITSSGDPVGTAHYYTEDAQSLFFTGSDLKTALIEAPEGQWGTPDAPITVDDTITYVNGRLDHPSFGIMYGAMSGGSLHLMVYIYAADISEWNMSATQIIQANSAVHGMKMLVADTDRELFENDNSLFSPTNVITTDVTWGDNEIWLPLYRWFIDSIPFDELRNAHAVQCRTALGMWFSDVSFDEDNEYTGQRDAVFKEIITDSVTVLDPSYITVQTDATAIELEFRPSEKRLTGLLRELNTIGWNIIQMPDWRIIVGDNAFIRSFQPNSRYSFSKANDVFTRKITRNADSAYTRVRAYAGDFIRIQYATISTFEGWNLPVKTWDIRGGQGSDPDDGMTDAELLSLAQETALKMQFIGVTETITGSMRPELLPNDVGQIYDPKLDAFISLGILTQVRHEFGNTFQTKFDLDSGGDFTDVGDEVESNTAIIKGANRTLRTSDFIKNSVDNALVKVSSRASSNLRSYEKYDHINTSIDVNPAVPYKTYLVDASSNVVTITLPDVEINDKRWYRILLKTDPNHAGVTTVSGGDSIKINNGIFDHVDLSTTGTGILLKADGVDSYEVITDTRPFYRTITLTDLAVDFTDGLESMAIYIGNLGDSENQIIIIGEPEIVHAGFFAKFAKHSGLNSTMRIKTADGISFDESIFQNETGFELTVIIDKDDNPQFELVQDSRPKQASAAINFYPSTNISVIEPTYRVLETVLQSEVIVTSNPITSIDELNPDVLGLWINDNQVLGGNLADSNLDSIIFVKMTSSFNRIPRIAFNFYEYDVDTTTLNPTPLVSTGFSPPIVAISNYQQVFISAVLPSNTWTNGVNKAIVIEALAVKSSAGGQNPTIDIRSGGMTPSKAVINIPIVSINHDSLNNVVIAATNINIGHIDNKALLQFPELTTIERNLLTPNNGMKIFNLTTAVFEKYVGGTWSADDTASSLQNWLNSVTINLTGGDHTLTGAELTTNLIIVSAVTLGNAIIAPSAVADERIEYTIDNRDLTNPVTVKINGGRGIDIPADTTAKVYYNDKVGIADYDIIDSVRANFSAWNNYTYGELSTFTENELEFVRII